MKWQKATMSCILVTSFLTGCSDLFQAEEVEEVVQEVALRSVEIQKVSTISMANNIVYAGRVAPSKEVTVVPSMSGKILECNFDIGDKVEEGDLLLDINISDLQDNMKNMEANYNLTELAFRNAERTYNNNIVLFDEGVISQSDIDQILYSYDTAKANLYSLEVQMEILQGSMKDAQLYAPSSGVVTSRNVELGGYASMGNPAYVLATLDPIRVNVGVSEHLINTISLGQELPVDINAVSDELPFLGEVAMINPIMDSTGMYTIGIDIPNEDNMIKSGMLAEVTFVLEADTSAVVVPTNSIITKDTGSYVYLVSRSGGSNATVKETKVELGMENGNMTQIVNGLAVGREVITKGQTYVSNGESVKITAESDAPDSEPTIVDIIGAMKEAKSSELLVEAVSDIVQNEAVDGVITDINEAVENMDIEGILEEDIVISLNEISNMVENVENGNTNTENINTENTYETNINTESVGNIENTMNTESVGNIENTMNTESVGNIENTINTESVGNIENTVNTVNTENIGMIENTVNTGNDETQGEE